MAATILIVEDEEQIARFLELELMHEGYTTCKADNGRSGLETAQSGECILYCLMSCFLNLMDWRSCADCAEPPICLL